MVVGGGSLELVGGQEERVFPHSHGVEVEEGGEGGHTPIAHHLHPVPLPTCEHESRFHTGVLLARSEVPHHQAFFC